MPARFVCMQDRLYVFHVRYVEYVERHPIIPTLAPVYLILMKGQSGISASAGLVRGSLQRVLSVQMKYNEVETETR